MGSRFAAFAAAVVAVVALGACSAPSQGQLASTATVTVNGNDVRPDRVRCSQQEWYRTIALGDDASGATVILDERDYPGIATSVRFHNFGGFTGTYSQGSGEAASTHFDGSTYVITGTANGATTARPTEPASAHFKISAKC